MKEMNPCGTQNQMLILSLGIFAILNVFTHVYLCLIVCFICLFVKELFISLCEIGKTI